MQPFTPRSARPHDEEDDRLIRQVAVGDTDAFEVLYQRYAPRLYGYLQAQLGYSEVAEEVCHDVLLVVWSQAAQFRQAARLSSWIYGIARHMARKARSRIISHDKMNTGAFEFGSDHQEQDINLLQQERDCAVARGVATLPYPVRNILILRYYHDYTYSQIAREMDCTEDTVNRRLRQGRRCLAAALRRTRPSCINF